MRRVIPVLIPLVVVCACSSTDSGTIQLVTGEETDTFSQSPQPTKLVVNAIDLNGNTTKLATASLPTDSIDLGNQSETSAGTIQVEATDSSGTNVLVYGQSLALEYGAVANSTLDVFVQRTNQFARLPSPLSDTRPAPTLGIFSGEFLFVGGGSDPTLAQTTQLYDFAALAPLSAPPGLPRAPMSMPISGTIGMLIDTQGATYYDFSQNAQTTDITAPAGHSFADVAGGQVVYDVDSTTGNVNYVFVVGSTRTTGQATQAILQINPNDTSNSNYVTGNLSWITVPGDARLGATATWVPGRGLVLTGGSASSAGIVVISPGTPAQVSTLQTTADPSMGAGAAGLYQDAEHLLLAGGITPTGQDAGIREVDLGSGTAASWGNLPVPLTGSSVFTFNSGGAYTGLVIGNELVSGLTHAYLLNSTGAKEVPTKVPHINARATTSPIGSIVIFGGSNGGEIESFYPTL